MRFNGPIPILFIIDSHASKDYRVSRLMTTLIERNSRISDFVPSVDGLTH